MAFSKGDSVRLKAPAQIGGVPHPAGAVGIVESIGRRGALAVRMEETGARGTVQKNRVALALHAISTTPDWIVTSNSAAQAPLRGLAQSAPPDIPRFLLTDQFEVVDRIQAQEAPRAVGLRAAVGQSAPLVLQVPGPADEPYVAVARHPSGAITFHLPEVAGAPLRDGGARPALVTFSIPVGPAALRGAEQPFVKRGIIGRVVKVVVMKVVDLVVGETVDVLARKLEQKLWNDRKEGWVQVSANGGQARVQHRLPKVPAGARGLLLIHGTFSNTLAAFSDLLQQQTLVALQATYADRIYGVEHFSFSKSPIDNVAEMLSALPSGPPMTLDVITHSRGGLVVRTLLAELNKRGPAAPIRLGRVILVAAPNQGTPLATPARWEDTLGWFANLLEILPDNPFTTAADWITSALSWLAQRIVSVPGLASMDMNGPVVTSLRRVAVPPGAEWYALAANFAPAQDDLALRLADMGVDGFFESANDLVVPTEGGWLLNAPAVAIPANRVGCFGIGGNLLPDHPELVNHVSFFSRPETHDFILNALNGRPLGLPAIVPTQPLPLRGTAAPATLAPVAAAAPRVELLDIGETALSVVKRMTRKNDFGRQDSLQLIVLPILGESGELESQSKRSSHKRRVAQLLASYSGATVLAPFRLDGHEDGAGGRWEKIIDGHRDIKNFVEGTLQRELTLEDVENLGDAMFETLFRDDVRRLYDQARSRHVRRKLNVIFTSMIPWVAELPWEFAFDRGIPAFLATSDVRFVRNVLTSVPADLIPVRNGPLRILVVSAQPRRSVSLSLAEERNLIESAFRPLIDRKAVTIEVLPEASPKDLHARVRDDQDSFDVVHFMGHGRFDELTDTGYLLFEDGKGDPQELSTSDVKNILRSREIKLVFLNACETARGAGPARAVRPRQSASADYNKGVAPGLVADGVPAVVANQYSVQDRSATTFAQHFYLCLAQGLSLGDAAREARIALNYSGGGLIGWGVPVLFARNPDAVLCQTSVKAVSPAPAARAAASPDDFVAGKLLPFALAAPSRYLSTAATPEISPVPDSDDVKGRTSQVLTVAVWDVNDAIPHLDEVVDAMNAAQSDIVFRVAPLSAPYGLWKLDANRFESEHYLPAERTAKRLKKLAASTKTDYLLCITDLPLADDQIANLYLWYGDDGADPELNDNRVIIFSTWGFEPSLTGELLQRALVNVSVQSLADLLADAPPADTAPGTIGYFNDERNVEQLASRLRMGAKNRRLLIDALEKRKLPPSLADSLEALLNLYGPPVELEAQASAKKAVSKTNPKSRRRRPAKRANPRKRSS